MTFTGTSSAETLYGTQYNDTANGLSGNDYLYGNRGNDDLYAADGSDYLYGGDGNDNLYGQGGADTLAGNGGADKFIFQSASAFGNVDIISDFTTAQNDVIDISDVLDGYYNSGTDVITDFVQITTNGGNSEVRVDVTGSASFGSGTQIATLSGVTGLTDEAALVTNGHLIAA